MLRTYSGLLSRALRLAIAEVQGSILDQAWKFFRFFFKPLGCSFNCEDNFHVTQLKLLKEEEARPAFVLEFRNKWYTSKLHCKIFIEFTPALYKTLEHNRLCVNWIT